MTPKNQCWFVYTGESLNEWTDKQKVYWVQPTYKWAVVLDSRPHTINRPTNNLPTPQASASLIVAPEEQEQTDTGRQFIAVALERVKAWSSGSNTYFKVKHFSLNAGIMTGQWDGGSLRASLLITSSRLRGAQIVFSRAMLLPAGGRGAGWGLLLELRPVM